MNISLVGVPIFMALMWWIATNLRRRWSRRSARRGEARQVDVLMLGFSGAGKTLMLAGMFSRFRFGGASGITMTTDDASERDLERIIGRIQDTDDDFLPEATPPGDPRTWSFGVRVDVAQGRGAEAFTLNYLDYAGEYAAALAGADGEMNEAFVTALRETDILMGVLDGDDVCRVLLGQARPETLVRMERLLRLLVRTDQRCVHLVISKWDALVDRDGRRMGLDEVVSRLEQVSENFRDFRLNPRFSTLRIIPVSTFGYGFAKQNAEGRMVKEHGAAWNPLNIDFPFYCAIPDILTGDVARMSAHRSGQDNRTTLTPERLAKVTLAVLDLAGIVLKHSGPGLLASVPIHAIVGRVRESLPRLLALTAGEPRFDDNAALAAVLQHCYARTSAFNDQWYVHPPVHRLHG